VSAEHPPTLEHFRARTGSTEPALDHLFTLVGGDAACLDELVEPVRLLGAAAVQAALNDGSLRVRDAELSGRFAALSPEIRRRLRVWAHFDVLELPWLGDGAAAVLVELARDGWVGRGPELAIPAPERLWLRATAGPSEQQEFAAHVEPLAAEVVRAYRRTRTHSDGARQHAGAIRRALEARLRTGVLDAWDRLRALALYRDPEAAAEHLRELEAWVDACDDPFAIVILNRHRRRIGGLEDRVVAEVAEVLGQLSGVEAMEARLTLSDCLGRIGSYNEAAEVAAGHAAPQTPEEEVVAVSLLAELGSQRMLADDLEAATEAFERSLVRARARAMETEQALIFGNLAMIAAMRGDPARGHRCLDAAAGHSVRSSASNRAMVDAVRAALHLQDGASEAVFAARARLGPVEQTGATARIIAELAAGLAGDPEAFARAAQTAAEHGTPEQAAMCAHFADGAPLPSHVANRCTLRMLGVTPAASRLQVDPEGRWFETADGRVELARYRVASRVLAALATADGPLSTAELVLRGWPGEKIRPDAAANRLYVTLNQLRKLGLRDWIVREAGGYVLDRCR
jgi:hypothetical protein